MFTVGHPVARWFALCNCWLTGVLRGWGCLRQEGLFSLAQRAGQTVAASAISDAWDSARNKAARLLGRGDRKREQLAWVQLEATHDRLAVREGVSLRRARHQEEARWTSRFVDLLEEDSGVETGLRALVEEFEPPLLVSAESRSRSTGASNSAEYSRWRGESVVPGIAAPPLPRRYLHGRLPDTVRPGQVFSLLVSVVRSGGAALKHFDVPEGGRQLLLLVDAPAIKVLSERRQYVLVPADGDSEPVKFDLIGDVPGPCRISVTAWDGGSYLTIFNFGSYRGRGRAWPGSPRAGRAGTASAGAGFSPARSAR
jgi:hypothetical protein